MRKATPTKEPAPGAAARLLALFAAAVLSAPLPSSAQKGGWSQETSIGPWETQVRDPSTPMWTVYNIGLHVDDISSSIDTLPSLIQNPCELRISGSDYNNLGDKLSFAVNFRCDTDKTRADATVERLRKLGKLGSLEIFPDSFETTLKKVEKKLAPYKLEYKSNRNYFKKLPIVSSLMEEKLAYWESARRTLLAEQAKNAVKIEFSLVKRLSAPMSKEELQELRKKFYSLKKNAVAE